MNILDYCISIGESKGNTKHFRNFIKIHSHIMKLERELITAKTMINAKNNLLIHKEQKERELQSEVSRLKIELSKKDQDNKLLQDQINNLLEEKTKNF